MCSGLLQYASRDPATQQYSMGHIPMLHSAFSGFAPVQLLPGVWPPQEGLAEEGATALSRVLTFLERPAWPAPGPIWQRYRRKCACFVAVRRQYKTYQALCCTDRPMWGGLITVCVGGLSLGVQCSAMGENSLVQNSRSSRSAIIVNLIGYVNLSIWSFSIFCICPCTVLTPEHLSPPVRRDHDTIYTLSSPPLLSPQSLYLLPSILPPSCSALPSNALGRTLVFNFPFLPPLLIYFHFFHILCPSFPRFYIHTHPFPHPLISTHSNFDVLVGCPRSLIFSADYSIVPILFAYLFSTQQQL